MTNEKYKEYINQMLSCIHDERDLNQIYTIVHGKFIKNRKKALGEAEK